MVAVADKVQKRFVDASVVGKLGVKRRRHDASLPHGDGIFIIAFSSKNFDAGTDARNLWGTDEDHFHRFISELSLADGAVNLAAIGVAANADIERTESGLLRVFHFGRQQDGSGTGAAAALHALTGQPVTSGNPAAAGEYISLFVTGLGVTYQSGGVSYASAPVFVVMAGGTVPASFAGSAPGFVGLYQVNFQVPSAAQHGPNTLVVASGRYFSSPQISIAVR